MPKITPMQPPFLVASGLAGVFLVLAGCRSNGEGRDSVAWLAQHGRFEEAVELARKEAEEDPDDRRAQRQYLEARVAAILESGRRAVFAGFPEQGLALFEQARELDPENPIVQSWIEKTNDQLATEWLDRAVDYAASERLANAEEAYEKVLEYDPDRAEARIGLARVLFLMNYRSGQSRSYFDEGVRTFRDLLLFQSRRQFYASYEYDRANERARERGIEVGALLSEERLAQAQGLEQRGLYHAARNEYRLSLLIDPSNAAAQEGIDRMDKETRAELILTKADMQLRRGDFDRATELASEAGELTEAQKDLTGRIHGEIEDARLRKMYDEARSLERDFRYVEAVEAYDRLLAMIDAYDDALPRRENVKEFIELAAQYYESAMQAQTDEEAADFLRRIPVFWPGYRDVEARLAELEKRKEEVPPPAEETPEPD
jgi:tetratricopeptide (TPR) repeat protein